MKKIETIIRESKFNDVKNGLEKIGITAFSYWEVGAVSREQLDTKKYRGVVVEAPEIKRTFISIVLNNAGEEPVIKAILDNATTGDIGDGKIFVYEVNESYRIRSGEKGVKILKAFVETVKETTEKTTSKMKGFYDKFK